MEPMTLGSPVSSPISSPSFNPYSSTGLITNTTQTSMATSNPFYPSYLMGESQITGSRIPPGSISPGRRTRQFSSSNAMNSPNSPQIGREGFFPSARIGGERQGGPPTMGLMGGIPQSPSARLQSTPFVEHQKIIGSPANLSTICASPTTGSFNMSLNLQQSNQPCTPYTPSREMFHGLCSETFVESQDTQLLEDTWVTIYGFPVASASYILTQFAQLGTIVDQKQPGLGNWMHIKYQTKLQARKALTKNSKIFNGNIMVGVVPCTDQSIASEKENINTLDKSLIFSPRPISSMPSTPKTPKTNIRPLTQAYQASRADLEITPSSNTPKKNDSLVSKAIQHILGV